MTECLISDILTVFVDSQCYSIERSQTFPSSKASSQIPESLTRLSPTLFLEGKDDNWLPFLQKYPIPSNGGEVIFCQHVPCNFSLGGLHPLKGKCSEKAVGRKKCGRVSFPVA